MPPTLIDTHAHLDDERFAADLPQVLERARAAGVANIVTIATTAATSRRSVELAQAHPMLYASVGIQPNHVAEAAPGDWDAVVDLVRQPKVVALGETGLDRYWDHTPFAQQEDYFARHMELSRRTGLPLVIHSRDVDGDMLRMLQSDFDAHGPIRGVMHSFSSNAAVAETCLAMGLYISFAGMVTYKNADNLRAAARRVPLDRILVETDSPYLVPVPLRGKEKRNEPGFVVHTAALLAQELGVSLEAFAAQTTANARLLFPFSA